MTKIAHIYTQPGTFTGIIDVGGADTPFSVAVVPFEASVTPLTGGVGQVFTITATGPISAIQALRNAAPVSGASITGANTATYTAVSADIGAALTFLVTPLGVQEPVEPGVTVAASAGITPDFLAGGANPGQGSLLGTHSCTLDLSSHNSADDIIVVVGTFTQNSGISLVETAGQCTLDGNNAASFVANLASGGSNGAGIAAIRFPAGTYAASSTLVIVCSGLFYDFGAAAYAVPAGASVSLLTSQAQTTRTDSTLSGNVDAGDGIIVGQMKINGTGSTYTYTGATEEYLVDTRTSEWFTAGSAGDVAAATPRTITIAGGGSTATAALSLVVS